VGSNADIVAMAGSGTERVAVVAWLGMMAATGFCAWQAAIRIQFAWPVIAAMGTVFLTGLVAGFGFLKQERPGSGKRFELLAGLWTLVLYLSLGLVPLLCACRADNHALGSLLHRRAGRRNGHKAALWRR
jgi:hypothetical protein